MEPMETDDGEKENHPKPSEDHVQQEESLLITKESSLCPKSSAAPAGENLDLLVVTTPDVEQTPRATYSTDLGQNEGSSISEMKDKSSTDGEEMHNEVDMQTEQEPVTALEVSATPSSPLSTPNIAVSVESVSLTNESLEPSCKVKPDSICKTDNASENTMEEESESAMRVDVDSSPSDDNSCKTVIVDAAESPRRPDATAISEQAGDVQPVTACVTSSATFVSVREAEDKNTEKSSEMETSQPDSGGLGQSSQDAVVFTPQKNKECLGKDADMPEDKACPSSSSKTQQSKSVNMTVLSSELVRSPSPTQPPLLKKQDADKDSGQEKCETPSKNDVDPEALKSEIQAAREPASSDETKTVNCESLKAERHSLCRRLSPLCLFPSVHLQALELHAHPEKMDFLRKIDPISSNRSTSQSSPKLEKGGLSEEAIVKDSPQDNIDTNNQNLSKCKLGTISPTTPLKQSDAATHRDNEYLESGTNVLEKQQPHRKEEDEQRPVGGSASAQPECIGQVRSEMGPPLPRLLTPLRTPPKVGKSINPRQAIGKLSFPSPLDRLASPTTPVQMHLTPNGQQLSSSSLNSPLRPNGVPSSPLQFGSATPKHAVPVPGRLPLTAMSSSQSSSSSPSQENSMRILDTMYPELSAHGRTLSILRGNVSLSICSSESGTLPTPAISQVSCFKTVNCTSTAFTKTEKRGEKRQSISSPESKTTKCPRLDKGSPAAGGKQLASSSSSREDSTSPETLRLNKLKNERTSLPAEATEHAEQSLIVNALKKVENQCFDLLPVIQSHLYVGNLPKKPVLRSEEKEVISEVCHSNSVSVCICSVCPSTFLSSVTNRIILRGTGIY